MKVFWCIFVIFFAVYRETMCQQKGSPFAICCKGTSNSGDGFSTKMKSLVEVCAKEISFKDKSQIACLFECVGKKLKNVNSDGSLNEGEFRNFVKTDVADEDYKKSIADATVTKCIEQAKAMEKEIQKQNNCGVVESIAVMCVEREFFKACPADKQNPAEQCVDFRKKVENSQQQQG